MDVPETRYTRSGDVSIAYQVVGEGPFDVVLVPGSLSHVELGWKVHCRRPHPRAARRVLTRDLVRQAWDRHVRSSYRRAHARGSNGRRPGGDGCGRFGTSRDPGVSEGAPISLLFAGTYPERTAALVLWGGMPRAMWAPDYTWGRPDRGVPGVHGGHRSGATSARERRLSGGSSAARRGSAE